MAVTKYELATGRIRFIIGALGLFLWVRFDENFLAYVGMVFFLAATTPLSLVASIVRFVAAPFLFFAPIIQRRMILRGVSAVTDEQLDAMRGEIVAIQHRLEIMQVFDPEDPELVAAWDNRNAAKVEALLKQGDSRTRSAWSRMASALNQISAHIDKARGNLRRVIRQSEALLARFKLKADDTRLQRSGIQVVKLQSALPPNVGPKQLNTKALSHSVVRIGNQVSHGNLGWQAGGAAILATVAIALVAQGIFNSRALRRLKDAEGQLATQADMVAGDIAANLRAVETLMLPHFDELLQLTRTMEDCIAQLVQLPVTAEVQQAPPHLAFQLAFTLREAKHYLKMTAG